MLPGFGRGAPATPPGRGLAGRSTAGDPKGLLPGRGAGRAMPVFPPNGLLPGRGAPGFGAGRAAGRGPDGAADVGAEDIGAEDVGVGPVVAAGPASA